MLIPELKMVASTYFQVNNFLQCCTILIMVFSAALCWKWYSVLCWIDNGLQHCSKLTIVFSTSLDWLIIFFIFFSLDTFDYLLFYASNFTNERQKKRESLSTKVKPKNRQHSSFCDALTKRTDLDLPFQCFLTFFTKWCIRHTVIRSN